MTFTCGERGYDVDVPCVTEYSKGTYSLRLDQLSTSALTDDYNTRVALIYGCGKTNLEVSFAIVSI